MRMVINLHALYKQRSYYHLSDCPVFKEDRPLCSKLLRELNRGDLISVGKVDILLIQKSVVHLT